MNCDDECAADKTEAKEFAYFSGLLTGRKNERERVIKLLKWDTRPASLTELLQLLEKGEIRHEMVLLQIISLIEGKNL
jgi:DNA-binding TFAR19-related protein (PDSD5 family)